MTDDGARARFDVVENRFADIERVLDQHATTMEKLVELIENVISTMEDTERRQDALRGNRTSKA